MKKTILFTLFSLFTVVSFAQSGPEATFDAKGLKFDNVLEGSKLNVVYHFKNTGNQPLIIQNAKPTCGCTLADYPKHPIAPGQRDSITATFDTKGRPGYNAKGVNLTTNAGLIDLVFEAQVLESDGTGIREEAQPVDDHSGHKH